MYQRCRRSSVSIRNQLESMYILRPRNDLIDCISIVKGFTPGWDTQLLQNGPALSSHGGVISGKLLCDILLSALCVGPNATFIDAGSGTGLIPNAVSLKFPTTYCVGVEYDFNRIELAREASDRLWDEYTGYPPGAIFFHGSFTDVDLMRQFLDRENVWVFFNNYGRSMIGFTQSGFELVLNDLCRRGARVATLSPLYLGSKWHCNEYVFDVREGDISWSDSYSKMKVYVYKRVLK